MIECVAALPDHFCNGALHHLVHSVLLCVLSTQHMLTGSHEHTNGVLAYTGELESYGYVATARRLCLYAVLSGAHHTWPRLSTATCGTAHALSRLLVPCLWPSSV